MEAQTIFYLFCLCPLLTLSLSLLIPSFSLFWSLFCGPRVLLLSRFLLLRTHTHSHIYCATFLFTFRFFRTPSRWFFLADFLSRFLLTVLRQFPPSENYALSEVNIRFTRIEQNVNAYVRWVCEYVLSLFFSGFSLLCLSYMYIYYFYSRVSKLLTTNGNWRLRAWMGVPRGRVKLIAAGTVSLIDRRRLAEVRIRSSSPTRERERERERETCASRLRSEIIRKSSTAKRHAETTFVTRANASGRRESTYNRSLTTSLRSKGLVRLNPENRACHLGWACEFERERKNAHLWLSFSNSTFLSFFA